MSVLTFCPAMFLFSVFTLITQAEIFSIDLFDQNPNAPAPKKESFGLTSSHSYKWYFSPQPNYPMHRQMNDFELAASVVHTNSTSNDGNTVGIPFNISAPGNTPTAWIHPDQTMVGGLSSVIGVGNVTAQTDVIASSSPWGPTTWEDLQVLHQSYPYPMPLNYQDYPYETVPGSMGLIKPDVSAPGNGTTSTTNGGGYASFSGTSGATPHACGTVALVLSANPNLTPAEVSMILQRTGVEKGDPGKDNRVRCWKNRCISGLPACNSNDSC